MKTIFFYWGQALTVQKLVISLGTLWDFLPEKQRSIFRLKHHLGSKCLSGFLNFAKHLCHFSFLLRFSVAFTGRNYERFEGNLEIVFKEVPEYPYISLTYHSFQYRQLVMILKQSGINNRAKGQASLAHLVDYIAVKTFR